MTRRTILAGSMGLAAGAATTAPFLLPRYDADCRPPRSRVAILHASDYSEDLTGILFDGMRLFNLPLSGKSVLLKPNLVDHIPGAHINTHPTLVAAAVECFKRLGARSVLVAVGPGHQRDTHLVVSQTGLLEQFRRVTTRFIDLNRDYRNSRSLEIKGHIETLLTLGRFDASMMLHEDYEGIGAYLYELNDTLASKQAAGGARPTTQDRSKAKKAKAARKPTKKRT